MGNYTHFPMMYVKKRIKMSLYIHEIKIEKVPGIVYCQCRTIPLRLFKNKSWFLYKLHIKFKILFHTNVIITVPWFSPMHKEGNKLCIIYLLIYGSVPYNYVYSPRNQITSCQYKLSKILVQRIVVAQSVLPS